MVTGTGFIVSGVAIQAPGIDVTNYRDMPELALTPREDMIDRPVGVRVQCVVLHTSKGLPGEPSGARPGFGPPVQAGLRCSRLWSTDARNAGAHLVVDQDGKVFQCADLHAHEAYHCPGFNQRGIGIELFQGRDGEVFEGAVGVLVLVCDWLSKTFGIQRQIPDRYRGPIRRFTDPGGAHDVVGFIGHRDAARNRGVGDPGNIVFNRLGQASYEPVNYDARDDLDSWRRRQRDLGITADGVPGAQTIAALKAATSIRGIKGTRPEGLWIPRPGDVGGPPIAPPF
jgi:hypothetical protein